MGAKRISARFLTIIFTLILLGGLAAAAQATNIYVNGFNCDEIFENGGGISAAVNNNVSNGAAWAMDGYTFGGGTITDGIPATSFLSETGSGVTYYFNSLVGVNALKLATGGSGGINVTDGKYAALHILAASGDGDSNGKSNIVLHFSTGLDSTYDNALNGADWHTGVDYQPVALSGTSGGLELVELYAGTTDPKEIATYDGYFFETALTLTAEDAARTLTSITFYDATNNVGHTSIYAVDGTPVPLPGGLLLLGSGLSGLWLRRKFRS